MEERRYQEEGNLLGHHTTSIEGDRVLLSNNV